VQSTEVGVADELSTIWYASRSEVVILTFGKFSRVCAHFDLVVAFYFWILSDRKKDRDVISKNHHLKTQKKKPLLSSSKSFSFFNC
jgi:hypothetical protein